MNVYDYIIIGAGISGLYAAEKLIDRASSLKILIIEKSSVIGGRAYNTKFHGVSVETGAGVGRWPHDKKLKNWVEKHLNHSIDIINCKLTYWNPYTRQFSNTPEMNVYEESQSLTYPTRYERSQLTFKNWIDKLKGIKYRKKFVYIASYDDYLKMDIVDAIENYHFQDIQPMSKIFGVEWTEHEERVASYLRSKNVDIHLNEIVKKIEKVDYNYIINNIYETKKLILAIPSEAAIPLLEHSGYVHTAQLLENNIGSQYFIRAYVHFKGSKNIIENNIGDEIVCGNPFRKIIPIDKEKRIYMIAYCDNIHTRFWRDLSNISKSKQIKKVQKELEKMFYDKNIIIDDLICFYHQHATHYYKPLSLEFSSREDFINHVVYIDDNFTMIGESVALNQGWVNSAIDTVKYLGL